MIADRSLRIKAQSLYAVHKMTVREIAASLKVSRSTIGRWIEEINTDELRFQARSKARGPYKQIVAPKPKRIQQHTAKPSQKIKPLNERKHLHIRKFDAVTQRRVLTPVDQLNDAAIIAEFMRIKGITKITPQDVGKRLDHHLATGEPLYLTRLARRKKSHANR